MSGRAKQGQERRRTRAPRRIALRQGLCLKRTAILLARSTSGSSSKCRPFEFFDTRQRGSPSPPAWLGTRQSVAPDVGRVIPAGLVDTMKTFSDFFGRVPMMQYNRRNLWSLR
jgi:hypothetical protein